MVKSLQLKLKKSWLFDVIGFRIRISIHDTLHLFMYISHTKNNSASIQRLTKINMS